MKRKSEFPLLPLLLVSTVVLLLLLFISQSYVLAMRMVERYTPLIDATMEIKLEASTAHLWFEELLTEDRERDIEQVRYHLQQALWYSRAMLEGGSNPEGVFIPLDDPELRQHIVNVRDALLLFSQQMEKRWLHYQEGGATSTYDERFDTIFDAFIEESDLVETRLQQLTTEAMVHFRRVQMLLMVLTLLIGSGMLYSLLRYHRRRQEQLHIISMANRELRSEMDLRKQIEKELERQATTDVLTGLANRLHMGNLLEREVVRSNRYHERFSLVMLDIDHFKEINDQYGHDSGDEVLREVATRGKSVLRESDIMARWGGEEFLILLPGTALEGALELAERCREQLDLEPFAGVGKVTASFGVAQHRNDESIRSLLRRTDEALYRAKDGGRNQVVLFEPA